MNDKAVDGCLMEVVVISVDWGHEFWFSEKECKTRGVRGDRQ